MSGPTERTIRRLFAMSGNICAFPGCETPLVEVSGTVTGEICHIRAQSPGGARFDHAQTEAQRHSFENLILLCGRHHKIVDAQPDIFPVAALEQIKAIGQEQVGRPERSTDADVARMLLSRLRHVDVAGNAGNIIVDSPGATVAGTINIRTSRKVEFLPPDGTIGADRDASRYVLYLIERYNKFASADTSRVAKLSFGAIAKNIESRHKAPWRALSIEEFPALCAYLQERIAKTRLARSNTAKGRGSFSTFEQYLTDTAR